MGGLGVFAWIAIGVVGGWTVSRLMVGADDDALRGTAAGMIGAVLAALGLRLLDPAPALGNVALDTSLTALAGSLWLAWLTCVAASGRRGDAGLQPDVHLTRSEGSDAAESLRPALTYAAAGDPTADQLLGHDAERYDDIGRLLAPTVAADLQGERRVTDTRVVTGFDAAGHRSSPDRVQVVTEWLRGR